MIQILSYGISFDTCIAIVLNEEAKAILRGKGLRNVSVIYNGVRFPSHTSSGLFQLEKESRIIFPAPYNYRKGFDRFVRTMSQLSGIITAYHAGLNEATFDGLMEIKEDYDALVRSGGIVELGLLPNEIFLSEPQGSKFMILPSRVEGMPRLY